MNTSLEMVKISAGQVQIRARYSLFCFFNDLLDTLYKKSDEKRISPDQIDALLFALDM